MILWLLLCCPSITVAEKCGTNSLNDDLSLLQVDLAAVSDSVETETKSEMEEEKEQGISNKESTDNPFTFEPTIPGLKKFCDEHLKWKMPGMASMHTAAWMKCVRCPDASCVRAALEEGP